ncbi:MAG: DMT family transporter [Pseudomonadota bacterium]|nr:DMT family transporter [Pseudomonadota bacterium]
MSKATTSVAQAWGHGLLGMLIFSASMPATRAAVAGFDPLFLTAARAAIAGALGLATLKVLNAPWPRAGDWPRLVLVAAGVVLGFPLFSALALTRITSAHSLIWIGLLPLATALFGVLLAGERPPARFWAFAVAGAACVVGFAATRSHGGEAAGDALMAAAVVAAGLGYVEGARLTTRLGGWQVISWALLLALPFSAVAAYLLHPVQWPSGAAPWAGLAYVSLFSMWIGFVFWYRGLALGGIAAVGQLQLLQPFFGLALSALLLREAVSASTYAVAGAVLVCVVGARRTARR